MSNIPGTNIAAEIAPFTTADNYPTHDSQFGLGGWHEVATIADRDAIPAERKRAGMVCNVTTPSGSPPVSGPFQWTGSAWVAFIPSPVDLQTDGVDNTDQTKLNLKSGTNITLTPDGSGGVTVTNDITPIALKTNGTTNGSQVLLNLKQGGNTTVVDDGVGGVTINSIIPNFVNLLDYNPPIIKLSKSFNITAATSSLSISSAGGNLFVPGDVGAAIKLPQCGPNYTDLWTTIQAYSTPTSVTIAATATVTEVG